jgi:uncharacterized protein
MRLDDLEESSNVEDRRGMRPSGRAVAGGGIGTLVLALIVMALGGDPRSLLSGASGAPTAPSSGEVNRGADDASRTFFKKIIGQTEKVWEEEFRRNGMRYQPTKLVMFSDQVDTACGAADSNVGPFYCPADKQVYIDPIFYNVMEKQLGAGGDFAQAYVVAHEVGHHIQKLLGVSDKVDAQRRRLSERDMNALSVRMELQADFYAGVWANHAKDLRLDRQDIEEAMNAAQQIGDDRLQSQGSGRVRPETFTHGTSAQRMRWFMKGYETGDMTQGDTFNTRNL